MADNDVRSGWNERMAAIVLTVAVSPALSTAPQGGCDTILWIIRAAPGLSAG